MFNYDNVVKTERQEYYILTIKCPICGDTQEIKLRCEDMEKYEKGALIQDAFPYLTIYEREALINGMCKDCINSMFDEDLANDEYHIKECKRVVVKGLLTIEELTAEERATLSNEDVKEEDVIAIFHAVDKRFAEEYETPLHDNMNTMNHIYNFLKFQGRITESD